MPRHVCDTCDTIHYQNPKIVAGCIPVWQDKILLCRRAIEPRYGLWTLPAGFMENGETTLAGAAREALEEAHARMDALKLFTFFSLPHISQVYVFYRGQLIDGFAEAGVESLEVELFDEANIPWHELAFPVVRETLKLFFKDRQRNDYRVHCGDLHRNENNEIIITLHGEERHT